MKKLGMFAVSALGFAAAVPVHVQAQAAATCESAYAENLATCEAGDSRCQVRVDNIYRRCKETGVIVYI